MVRRRVTLFGLRLVLGLVATACRQGAPARSEREVAPIRTETSVAPSLELLRQEQRAAAVEIIRDDFGVPHIYGKSDADAVFGLLYAQAEDDFPRIERNYLWATGRLAEVEGEGALFSDLRARLYMSVDEAKAHYERTPAWLKDLCVAYADGLNFYLATHPEVKPKLLTRFEPWMPMFFFEGSIGGDIEQIPLGQIEAFYSERREAPKRPELPIDAREPRGSNGFAIAGPRTRSGDAMLLINPHTSFYFRGEVHVVSEEGLNAYGAVTWGQFFVYQGFNAHNGWMHTSTYADFMDVFVEEVFEEDGKLVYRYGDERREVEVGSVTLAYRAADGSRMERTFETYRTHHGPITHMIDGKWASTKINWDPPRALEQSYVRTKTADHEGFLAMMDIRNNSSNNTVYADAQGNIAYYHGNFMPRRDPKFDYSKPVDGSDPATDWKGTHPVAEMVTLLNPANGWLQNCNSSPFSAAQEYSPVRAEYPRYMAPDPENFRAAHAVAMLKDARDLTLDSLVELAYDPHVPGLEAVIPGVVKAFDHAAKGAKLADSSLSTAIELLRAWDYRASVDSSAMTIAHFYGLQVLTSERGPAASSRMERLKKFGSEASADDQLHLLTAALQGMKRDYGSSEIAWGEVNRLQRLDGAINSRFDDAKPSLPIGLASGRWGALASFGAGQGEGTKKLYGRGGNSFVAVVEFGDRVRAKSLLAGGQSGDAQSPHFFDQAQRYQGHEFKDVAYYREDVEARAASRYHPGASK